MAFCTSSGFWDELPGHVPGMVGLLVCGSGGVGADVGAEVGKLVGGKSQITTLGEAWVPTL